MTGPLTPSVPPKLKFFIPGTTNVASGAKIFTYAAGTTTKQATYSTPTGTPNTNPIILDANGECVCYLDSTLEYDFWYCPSTDTDPPTNPYWTVGSVGFGNMINGLAPLNSPAFTGTPTAPTATVGDSSTDIANTQFVQTAITNAFSNNPTVPTQSAGDYSTKIATTAYVGNEINRAWQMAVFTNSGTWTIPTNVKWAKFRIWGGGGGGGGASGNNAGSGGGGAGYAEGPISLSSNTSLAIVIGAGGTGGSSGNAGTAGGNSTITALGITANGGGGGGGNAGSAGAGGGASGLTLNLSGTSGQIGQSGLMGSTTVYQGGAGGDAPLGGSGGPGSVAGNNPGELAGGGGSGGGPLVAGGNGASGLCIIEWLSP